MKYIKILGFVLLISVSNSHAQKSDSKFNKIIVKEILRVNSYTYLFVEETGVNKWLAVPYFEAKIGETYYYKGGMEMKNFKSKELKRTFDSVYFISAIYDNPFVKKDKTTYKHSANIDLSKDIKSKKTILDIKIEPVTGTISIFDLYKNKKKYAGKKVRIKGQVAKFNSQVMSKNWVHLQDGTKFNDKYDLTFTTNEILKIGDIVILEGTVFLDKDFGYGYFYELIIENSILIK